MNATNTLFRESIRKRPSRHDERIVRLAAEKTFDRREDYGVEVDDYDSATESAINDIASVISGSRDGYEMARDLERKGWYCTSQMVEWLDGADYDLYSAHDQAVAEWVAAEGIKPSLAIGASVTFTTPAFHAKGRGPTLAGEITAIDEKHARYTVFVPELGHVREGCGTHGIILPFEEIESA